jgi:hypothetical protein
MQARAKGSLLTLRSADDEVTVGLLNKRRLRREPSPGMEIAQLTAGRHHSAFVRKKHGSLSNRLPKAA